MIFSSNFETTKYGLLEIPKNTTKFKEFGTFRLIKSLVGYPVYRIEIEYIYLEPLTTACLTKVCDKSPAFYLPHFETASGDTYTEIQYIRIVNYDFFHFCTK